MPIQPPLLIPRPLSRGNASDQASSPYGPALRPDSPMITLNSSQQDLLNEDLGLPHNPGFRNLTPLSTASNSPILRAHERPFYSSSAAQSTEALLPPTKRATFQRKTTDSIDSNFITEYYARPRSNFDNWSNHNDSTTELVPPQNPFVTPTPSIFGYDDSSRPSTRGGNGEGDEYSMHTIQEKFSIFPTEDLLIYPKDVEADDYMHTPEPNEKDKRDRNIFTKRGAVNLGGLLFMIGGLFFIFIGLPTLFFIQHVIVDKHPEPCSGYECLNVGDRPIIKNVRSSLIDTDTPQSAKKKTAANGKKYNLVFSDEFNTDGRTFYPGDDPYWEAVDIYYAATQDVEWYDPDAITTKDGVLEITFDAWRNHNLNFRSGMLQSWNKMCFKGGIIEASISLPGRGDISGFWGSFWTMGNLGRPGYLATTDGMWPYSYNECDAGITPNQSSPDGISYLPGMRLPNCACPGEDHPTPGKGRSAPEIDIIEASSSPLNANDNIGVVSQSGQFAPFDIWYQPNYDHVAVFNTSVTMINSYAGGPFQQAMSGVTSLNNDWYNGKQYQIYGFEYETGAKGMIQWHIGDEPVWRMNGASVGPNGNIGQRLVPVEPMSVIFNLGMSESFAYVDWVELSKLYPAKMRVDWIRIYQPAGEESVTCDPPGYETTDYIANHPIAYQNPNVTLWKNTNYTWPTNKLMNNNCK